MPLTAILLSSMLVPGFTGCEDEPDPSRVPELIAAPALANDSSSAAASPEDPPTPAMQERVNKILNAPTALHTWIAYKALLKESNPDELRDLQAGPHDSIAAQLAWQQVVERTFDDASTEPAGRRGTKLDRRALQRFIGFVEGRFRISAPAWWEKVVMGAKAYERNSFSFPVERHLRYEETAFGAYAPPDTAIETRDQEIILRANGESITIPAAVLPEQSKCFPSAIAHFAGGRCYLALHGSNGGTFPLFCIERASGEVLWKADVWANGTVLVYSGTLRAGERAGDHAVAIEEQGDRVVVFGAEGISAYVEVFKANDGANLARFCTSY